MTKGQRYEAEKLRITVPSFFTHIPHKIPLKRWGRGFLEKDYPLSDQRSDREHENSMTHISRGGRLPRPIPDAGGLAHAQYT